MEAPEERLASHKERNRADSRSLRGGLVFAAALTALFEGAHLLVHADVPAALGGRMMGVASGVLFCLAICVGSGGGICWVARKAGALDKLRRGLMLPVEMVRRMWRGDIEQDVQLGGRIVDHGVALGLYFSSLAVVAHTVIGQFHESVRISLLIAGLGALLALPLLLALPVLLRRIRGRIAFRDGVARVCMRVGLLLALGILVAGGLVTLWLRDAIFGAVDIFPPAMALLFVVVIFVSAPLANRRAVQLLGRIPMWAIGGGSLVAGIGIAGLSADARGAVEQGGALSSVVYRVAHRVLDMDDDGFSWLIGGDCHPWDAARGPFANEIPNNGIDENCDGSDAPNDESAYTDPLSRLPRPPDALRRPKGNVLVLISDATSAKHLKMYGYGRNTMPALETFASKSAIFDHAFSAGNHTSIAMSALLTSRYPSAFPKIASHGWNSFSLPPETNPIQVRLNRAGYQTVISAGHKMGGFIRAFKNVFRAKRRRLTAEAVAQHALEQLEAVGPAPAKPVFHLVHAIDPHHPYQAPKSPNRYGRRALDRYDAELTYVDQSYKSILSLVQQPAYRDWLVVITADHGEAHGEHGKRHHGFTLYDEEVHVPLIMRIPGVEETRIQTAVSLLDIVPTLMDWCGLPADPNDEGKSLLPLFGREVDVASTHDRVVFSEFFRTGALFGAFSAEGALIYNKRQGRFELYDTKKDPGQKRNRYERGRSPALERQLMRHVRRSLNRIATGD